MTSPVLRAALALAAKGVKVFPFGPDARPLPGQIKAQSAATTDPAMIEDAWRRWPGAVLHALTGAREDGGLGLVVDLDAKNGKDGFASLRAVEDMLGALPPTLTCTTPSGGEHRHFLWPGGVVRSTDSELGPGIDTKGTKGQIAMPPSSKPSGSYAWRDSHCEVARLPDAYVALLRPKERPQRHRPPINGDGSAYARAVLRGEAEKLAHAKDGARQRAANSCAFVVGTVVHAGLSVGEAETVLVDAAMACGLTERVALETVPRAIRKGMAVPRDLSACRR